MSTLFQLMGLCLWVLNYCQNTAGSSEIIVRATLSINGSSAIAETDADFICATLDWWPPEKCDYGKCSWDHASVLNLDLNNTILLNAIKAFSPLKIRVGGTLQDKVIYVPGYPRHRDPSFIKNHSELFGFTQGFLSMTRWDELNVFFRKAGAEVIFGLNALNGRISHPNGTLDGPWDSDNAASFIYHTASSGYSILGWELGNELSGRGVGARVNAAQYAEDVMHLHTIIDDNYFDEAKPLLIAPGGFFDKNWFKEFVNRMLPNSLNVITHHIYNLGPGADEQLVEKILDPDYLSGAATIFKDLQNLLIDSNTSAVAWVGEAGGAYNSGRDHVSNAFISSFWYLDQLGMSAKYDTKTYCRQSLVGGNYGLLNTTTFVPNPDYYSALLWHKLMGRNVLAVSLSGTKLLRAYAHCARASVGLSVLLINLSSNTTFHVDIASAHPSISLIQNSDLHYQSSSWFNGISHLRKSNQVGIRKEYHLTAKDGDIQSQKICLNGEILGLTSDGKIPSLAPFSVNSSDPIIVEPHSIVFATLDDIIVPACRV